MAGHLPPSSLTREEAKEESIYFNILISQEVIPQRRWISADEKQLMRRREGYREKNKEFLTI
jgi:hypothetical protein